VKNNKVVYIKDMKRTNQVIFLNAIFYQKEMSRTELAEFTGLNPATVAVLTKELLDIKMIVEIWEITPNSGKKVTKVSLLQINPHGGCICAVSVLSNTITYTLFNMQLDKIEEFIVENSEEIILQQLFENLVENIDLLLANRPKVSKKLLGISISIPREYDDMDRKVLLDTGVSADRMNLDFALGFKYKQPVFIEPTIHSRAIAEYYLGAAKNMEEFIFIDVSEDIQTVVVQKGQIVKMPLVVHSNLGHIIIDRNGPKCSCGQRGCLGVLVTTGAIVKRVKRELLGEKATLVHELSGGDMNQVNFDMIIRCTNEGDRFIEDIIAKTAEMLCTGIFNMMALLNINNVVIDGKVGRLTNFSHALAEAWGKHILFQKERSCLLVTSLPLEEVNIGNGAIVLSTYLETGFIENELAAYDSNYRKYEYK